MVNSLKNNDALFLAQRLVYSTSIDDFFGDTKHRREVWFLASQ